LASAPIEELLNGRFEPVIADPDELSRDQVRRIVFCSGKVFYDLLEARRAHRIEHAAIIRIEELYPFPVNEYAATLKYYAGAREIVWCQEEPENQGAWYQIRHRLHESLGPEQSLSYAGRPGAAAPASGIFQLHVQQQQALVEQALDVVKD
jgi:2-oxoglutarate dehydrogenase E1 component